MVTLQLDTLLGERSHYWLAQTTQLSHSTVKRLARPEARGISYYTLDKLCDALGCQPGDLLSRVPEPPALMQLPQP